MENIKSTPVMSTSMNTNYALFKYLYAAEIAKKHSDKGIDIKAHYLSTRGARSGYNLTRVWPRYRCS
jgi:hypothetical protein